MCHVLPLQLRRPPFHLGLLHFYRPTWPDMTAMPLIYDEAFLLVPI